MKTGKTRKRADSELCPEQEAAVRAAAPEVVVFAAAGSGKTRVLVERFVREAKAGVPVDRIAAVTYTEKAAGELQRRIADRFREEGIEDCVRLLESGWVTTIHGFAAKLLRGYPIDAGIDPRFIQIDEETSELIRREALDKVFLAALAEDRYTPLLRSHARDEIEAAMLSLYGRWRSGRAPLREGHEPDPDEASRLLDGVRRTASALDLAAEVPEPGAPNAIETLASIRAAAGFARRKGTKEAVLEHREAVDAAVAHLVDLGAAAAGRLFLSLFADFHRRYSALKKERALLDFDDLMHRTLELLDRPDVSRRIQASFTALLVDEYQDTNPLQAGIFEKLAGGKSLFYVGDARQSIYAFRHADCRVFLSKLGHASGRAVCRLSENHRARPHLVEFVNAVFQDANAAGNLPFGAMTPNREVWKEAPPVEVIAVPGPRGDEEEGVADARAREADAIAGRMRAFKGRLMIAPPREEATHPPAWRRPVQWKDMALLVPARTALREYEDAFRRHHVPYHVVKGRGFYERREIYDVLDALESVLDPSNDLRLMACAKSPLVGLTDDALYRIRKENGKKSFYEAALAGAVPDGLKENDRRRLVAFRGWFSRLLQRRRALKASEMIRELVEATDYDAFLLAMEDGERRYANLMKLREKAVRFDRDPQSGLERFVRFIRDVSFREVRESEAALESEGGNAVRILTVHAAKGLEFPVVFVAGIGEKKSSAGARKSFLITDEGEVLCGIPNPLKERKPPYDQAVLRGRRLREVQEAEEESGIEEYFRWFYVAVTRATEHLVLSGFTPRPAKKATAGEARFERRWMGLLVRALPDVLDKEFSGEVRLGAGTVLIRRRAEDPDGAVPDDGARAAPGREAELPAAEALERLILPVSRDYEQTLHFTVSDLTAERLAGEKIVPRAGISVSDPRTEKGSGYGEVYHTVMQHIDFANPAPAQITRLLQSFGRGLDADTLASLKESAETFLRQPDADAVKRAVRAGRAVYRELPFLLRIRRPGRDLGFLVGQVDLLYRSEKGWVLGDYKTGGEHADAHAHQLRLYAFALSRLLGEKICRAFLYYADTATIRDVGLEEAESSAFEEGIFGAFERLKAKATARSGDIEPAEAEVLQ